MCIGVFIKCANSFNVNVALVFLLLISSLIIAYTINDYAKEKKENYEEYSKLRYSNDLKTAEDFKEELLERNIYGEPNRLITYDVSLSHKVSFNDSFEKASRAYTYDGYNTNNENYVWRIYYINGKIYAKLAEYTETKLSYNVHEVGDFISEDKIIYTYNKYSDKYELVNLENSNCKETDDQYYCRNYIIVDRIDSNTLDNYANSYFIENGINLSS